MSTPPTNQQVAHRRKLHCEVQQEMSPSLPQRKKRQKRRPSWTNARVTESWILLLLVFFITALLLFRLSGIFRRVPRKQPIITGHVFQPTSSEEYLEKQGIPYRLVFTHRYNLLSDDWKNTEQIENDELDELIVLQQNVHHIIDLHPSATIEFWTDEDCIAALRRVAPASQQDEWIHYFQSESKGMYKADWCRGVALMEQGGVYFDVDLGVRQNVFDVLQSNTTFATVKVHRQSQHLGSFFQAFIAVSPQHPVMKRYVELFAEYYAGHNPANGPLGVLFLRQAYDELVTTNPSINATTELWQEVLYHKSMRNYFSEDFKPPVWGTRRACHFVVVARLEVPLVVPFYSRIAGSRMCPVES